MSTSSQPSSSINNNNEPDVFITGKKDQASVLRDREISNQLGSSVQQGVGSLPSSLSYHQTNNISSSVSPRIPRKRIQQSDIHNQQDDLDNFNTDDQKPILSSPSIIITTSSPNTPISQPHNSLNHHHHNMSSLIPSDEDYDLDREENDSPRSKMLIKDCRSNWIPMDDFQKSGQAEHDKQHGRQLSGKEHYSTKIDVSLYTTKKNVAQGMLDIALLSANCSQLKYLLYHYERNVPISSSPSKSTSTITGWFGNGSNIHSLDFYFTTNLICIGISIFLQIIVGILLILNSRHNVYIHRYQRVADSYSNWILLAVFVVTVVNIFLSVFITAR